MFDPALFFNIPHGQREPVAPAELRRRQILHTADLATTRDPRPMATLPQRQFGFDRRPAER